MKKITLLFTVPMMLAWVAFAIQPEIDSEIIHTTNLNKPVDSYQVIRVDGTILFVKSGKNMLRGDVFAENEKIDFKTKESRAAVISKLNGRKILAPEGSSGKAQLLPAMNNVATRSGALINSIDLRNYFSGKFLLFGVFETTINSESYPMSTENFFFVRYEYEGETIPKKLDFNQERLIINTEELYKIDGNPIDRSKVSGMSLYYREGTKNTMVAEFTPIAPSQEDLKEEISIILQQTSAKTEAEKLDEIHAYLNEFYGKCSKDVAKLWFAESLKK